MAHPPRLAKVLLDWLAPGNEALRGDLAEEFAAGRGARWYWRQVISAVAIEGPLAVRARAVARFESVATGLITLLLLGFYAVFVVNVTDWLLRFEGVHLLTRVPDVLGFWNGTAVGVTLLVGLLVGKLIHAGHGDHRVASIVAFGGTTMLCAAAALQAATLAQGGEAFLPELVQQVTSTAAFVVGLIGGVTAPGRMPEGLRLFTHRTARPLRGAM